ncbi:MAG: M48 family metallopeptidase [Flavobacteriaceae bacterium]|jgi:predicted Zn-dependent protease|nr:M48 family metallopeptidase [Flavobacteriaceae bacterium]
MKTKKTLLLFVAVLLTVACATNPLTGRKSLSLVSNSQILPSSFQQYQEVLSSSKIITGTSQAKEVSEVGNRIKNAAEAYYKSIGKASELEGYEWQFALIDDPKTINAWCMPGGKVAVYTGILSVCKDDTGLAVVLGHEIAHALAGHGAEKISQAYVAGIGGQLLGGVTNNEAMQGIINQYYPVASGLTLLRYGRKQETDADTMGLYIMAMAGYDPRQAPIFWQRMVENTGSSSTPEFLSTHPDPQKRIIDLNKIMPQALEYYTASQRGNIYTPSANGKSNATGQTTKQPKPKTDNTSSKPYIYK